MTSYPGTSSGRMPAAAIKAVTLCQALIDEGAVPVDPPGRLSFRLVSSSTTDVLEQQWLLRVQPGGRG